MRVSGVSRGVRANALPEALPESPRRGRTGDGMACGLRGEIADSVSGLATADSLREKGAVDGEKKGPVSKEQPEAQPAAAEPTKVGEYGPKLDDAMALAESLVVSVPAATAPAEATISASATDSSAILDWWYIRLLHLKIYVY